MPVMMVVEMLMDGRYLMIVEMKKEETTNWGGGEYYMGEKEMSVNHKPHGRMRVFN